VSELTRVLEEMETRGVDALVLGREANARVVADTTRLWLAGTRAFAPGCVVVRATGRVHVLANSDDAVPDGFPTECLYGITWNTEKLRAALVAIDGFTSARVVGVDGMTPAMYALLIEAIPGLVLVDAATVLHAVWSEPTEARIVGVRAAAAVATTGLAAMAGALRPDVWPRSLRGACARAFAMSGVTTPAFEGVAAPLDGKLSTWLAPERMLTEGEMVVLRAGVVRDGWEASVARTYEVHARAPIAQPAPDAWAATLERLRPGAKAGELRALGAIVYGVGRGVEPWDDDFSLFAGATCVLELADKHGVRQDVVHVRDGSLELLT
jgi:Xaa-Pro aminopeptidase